MKRFFVLLAVLHAASAFASSPKFSTGGFLFTVQWGEGFWKLGRQHIDSQIGAPNGEYYTQDAQNTPATFALRAGYNILGHATIEGQITATGWNLWDPSRGGGGRASGGVRWHPLELVFINKPERPLPIDASIAYGLGYGIMGQRRGADGLVHTFEMNVDYYFNRFFGLGFFFRMTYLDWHSFYLDYDNRSLPGNTLTLNQGLDGFFWHVGISMNLRFGD